MDGGLPVGRGSGLAGVCVHVNVCFEAERPAVVGCLRCPRVSIGLTRLTRRVRPASTSPLLSFDSAGVAVKIPPSGKDGTIPPERH